ncbi:DUF3429 domain-containing protein [Thaumasiovibrio subtropicus]|uniref:DUF3429 domain-containing protein n=1 Tax=Thaumasiovibrio subtropicus TaxID=1891207 RepID=UPI000B34DBC7|nr:DUF3429 domain-containing protein [Thaumasiovibrio subtropicus]
MYTLNPISTKLGYAGLIPFIAFTGLAFFSHGQWPGQTIAFPITSFILYSGVIAAFMAGTLWGRDIEQKKPRASLASNGLALLAFTALLLPTAQTAIALAILALVHLGNWWVERELISPCNAYLRLRITLTSVVVGTHLLMLITLL